MRKLLYATGNPAKFSAMQRRLAPLGIKLQSLDELKRMGVALPAVEENGETPLENARIKAMAYYEAFRIPVFSCDSGLYFEGLAKEKQPGAHVRSLNGITLSDEQVRQRMIDLVNEYGTLTAYYKHAICLVTGPGCICEAMDESTESKRFFITDKPHSDVNRGFPIDSLSVDIASGTYYYDLPAGEIDKLAVEEGVLRFFEKYNFK